MAIRNKEKISPLQEKLLHYPGQSLDDALDSLKPDILECYLAPIVAGFLTVIEWYRLFLKFPPQPVTFTVITLLILFYSIRKVQPLLTKRQLSAKGGIENVSWGNILKNFVLRGSMFYMT